MKPTLFPLLIAIGAIVPFCWSQNGSDNSSYLQATAIVKTSKNISAFECWQFKDSVTIDANKGTAGAQIFTFPKGVATIRYSVFPPSYDIGSTTPHNPPAAQYVISYKTTIEVTC